MKRLLILMYHLVDFPRHPRERALCCLPKRFRQQMRWLRESGRPVIALDKILGTADIPNDAIAVTFDDGFTTLETHALPVLREFGIPATLFVLPGRIGGDNEWMWRNGLPKRRLLDLPGLRRFQQAGIGIGCHTATHPHLPRLGDAALLREIRDARHRLSDHIGQNVALFAYPFGEYGQRERDIVAESGYGAACTTQAGFNSDPVDLLQLRRIEIRGDDSLGEYRRKLQFGANRVGFDGLTRYFLGQVRKHIHV